MSISPAVAAFIEARKAQAKSFPLSALLILYARSHKRDTYCDYYAGLRCLINYLSPLSYPDIQETQFKLSDIPQELATFEVRELSKLLGLPEQIIFYTLLEIHYGSEAATTLLLKSGNTIPMSQKISAPEIR